MNRAFNVASQLAGIIAVGNYVEKSEEEKRSIRKTIGKRQEKGKEPLLYDSSGSSYGSLKEGSPLERLETILDSTTNMGKERRGKWREEVRNGKRYPITQSPPEFEEASISVDGLSQQDKHAHMDAHSQKGDEDGIISVVEDWRKLYIERTCGYNTSLSHSHSGRRRNQRVCVV